MRMAFGFALLAGMTVAALADTGPVVVIPSRAGVPIVIDGVDASFAVVEGDWGLGRGIHVQPTIFGGWPAGMPRPAGHYFPRTGRRPGYGRYEINTPPRVLPGAERYYRSWSTESPRGYEPPPVPADPPQIIYSPEPRGRGQQLQPQPRR